MHAGYTASGRSEEECFHLSCAGLILSLLFSLSCVLYICGSCKYSFYVSSLQAGIVKKENIKIHGFWIAAACRSISICGLHYSRHAIVDSLWSESYTVAIIHVTLLYVRPSRVNLVVLLLTVSCGRVIMDCTKAFIHILFRNTNFLFSIDDCALIGCI